MIELEAMKPLPTEYVFSKVNLSWQEVAWGFEMGWLDWTSLVQFAQKHLKKGTSDVAVATLATLRKDQSREAGKLARTLAQAEELLPEDVIRSKWQYLVLEKISEDWSWENQKIRIEEAFAEFNYPSDMKSFIGFMPASPETKKEWEKGANPEKLLQKRVREYLESARKRFHKP